MKSQQELRTELYALMEMVNAEYRHIGGIIDMHEWVDGRDVLVLGVHQIPASYNLRSDERSSLTYQAGERMYDGYTVFRIIAKDGVLHDQCPEDHPDDLVAADWTAIPSAYIGDDAQSAFDVLKDSGIMEPFREGSFPIETPDYSSPLEYGTLLKCTKCGAFDDQWTKTWLAIDGDAIRKVVTGRTSADSFDGSIHGVGKYYIECDTGNPKWNGRIFMQIESMDGKVQHMNGDIDKDIVPWLKLLAETVYWDEENFQPPHGG